MPWLRSGIVRGLSCGTPGLRQRLEHQLGDRPVSFEVSVHTVRVAAARFDVVGDGSLEIHQRDIVLQRRPITAGAGTVAALGAPSRSRASRRPSR